MEERQTNTLPAQPDANDWLKSLSVPGTALLEPWTSESTRSEGKQLLLFSLVTLLLAADLVKITEGGAAGLKIEAGPYFNAVAVMGLICLYLLCSYALAVRRDWQWTSYKRFPAFQEHFRLCEQVANEQREKVRRIGRLDAAIDRALAVRQAKLDEIHQTARQGRHAPTDDSEELETRLLDYRLQKQKTEEFEAYCRSDGVDQLQAELWNLASDWTASERTKALRAVLEETKRLDKYRVIMDVIFPTALSLSAISLSIYHFCRTWF